MVSVLVWGTLYSLQWSEKEQDYFYPTLKAMAAVSKVNNYGDSMLLCSTPKHTQTLSAAFMSTHAKTCLNKEFGYIFNCQPCKQGEKVKMA